MALSLQAVFRLALRQTEGLIGSVIGLLDLDLAIPAHTTLCRRADSLDVPCPRFDPAAGGMHLIVDSTGLKFHGPGEWLVEKHATQTRRSWRKPHMGMDADSGQIVAAELTTNDVDDASQVEPLLEQIIGPLASFTADGAYDTEDVSTAVAQRHPDAAVIVPPRTNAAESEIAQTNPTQRHLHLKCIDEHGRIARQKAFGYNRRSRVESAIGRFKQVIGDGVRSRTDDRQDTEIAVAIRVLESDAGVWAP
jgi:hypothetical protein